MVGYLRPTAAIAPDVLLPADPGLAMALAQRLTERPLMANHHHGLWGYTGRTGSGRPLTVQAGGLGAPSTAAVVGELHRLGARRLIRVGRCAALDPALAVGEIVHAGSALGADGTSRALGAELCHPDRDLAGALGAALTPPVDPVAAASFDLGVEAIPATVRRRWEAAAIAVVDLETAALFALGARLGLATASGLVVAGRAGMQAEDEGAVDSALVALGEAGAAALAGAAAAPGPASRA